MGAGRNTFHLILALQLHFLEIHFFEEGFRTEVRICGDSLKFRFVLRMLLGQTLILGVCVEEYVPRVASQTGHAFLLTTPGKF
jgi:hypothetical protein